MAVKVVEAIADAIMHYEGWHPHSLSYRNRNPGNLRQPTHTFPCDEHGFTIYPSMQLGYCELLDDISWKISGDNVHGLSATSTLLQFFEVYAPSGDDNKPIEYAESVAMWLRDVYGTIGIDSTWTFARIYAAVREDVPRGVANS